MQPEQTNTLEQYLLVEIAKEIDGPMQFDETKPQHKSLGLVF